MEEPIIFLEEGEPAPFAGDLFPPEKSIRLGIRLETCQERLILDLSHAKQIFEIELRRCEDRAAARLNAANQRAEVYKRELEAAQAWYRSPPFIAGVAVVATVATILATAALADAVLNHGAGI